MIAETLSVPAGWIANASRPQDYVIGTDLTTGRNGSASGTIAARVERPEGFGTLMQQCLATNYRGRRVRLTGYLKAANVTGWAGMWFRIDGPGGERPLQGFDNMHNRPLKGTSDWTQYAIVLDVSDTSHALAFGALLDGPGQVWIDDLQFDIVGPEVPVTASAPLHPQPVNLGFDQAL